METLKDLVALVAGGAGVIGSATVRAFLALGATVVVPSRPQQRLDDLIAAVHENERSRLLTLVASAGTTHGVDQIVKFLDEKNLKVNHVVSSLGGFWMKGQTIGQPVSEWDEVFESGSRSHFIFSSQLLPQIADTEGATYTYVTGRGGEPMFMKSVGLVGINQGAMYGLIVVAREEMKEKPVRVNEFRLGLLVTKENRELADECGRVVAGLATPKGLAVEEEFVRIAKREDLATWHRKLY
ncbi:dehydrogenase/reductase SDR family member 2, mitochondrial-like [Oscarella lobularis]|uniref:dehydrogenase/reductase SDR family member 2, mitochondrial-like n=1 Tax=Oscarella lobularis TaxID=121494 RepID=UPI0033135DD5